MIEFEPNRRMVVEVLDAPMPVRIVIGFTPVEGGTRLDWTGIISPRGILGADGAPDGSLLPDGIREGPEEPQGPDGPAPTLGEGRRA